MQKWDWIPAKGKREGGWVNRKCVYGVVFHSSRCIKRWGRRNDEENECKGIRRRGERGDLGGLWQQCAPLNYPTYVHAIIRPNE